MRKPNTNIVLAATLLSLAITLLIGCSGEQQVNEVLDNAMTLAQQGDKTLVELDWSGYVSMVHPDDLARFKSSLLLEFERLTMIRKADSITIFDQTYSIQDLRSKTPEEFFINIMTLIFRISPELDNSFKNMKNKFIGAVVENDSLIHVVANTKMLLGTKQVDEMDIISVRKFEDEWKLRLSTKVQGIALMLQQSLQMQQR
ncbi:MAG: hypothetical protein JSV52_09820 [Candidatus Zixiibacteriota bacterium]|nr:MAG: hypothetical protein JSV52_09820 [candidate division Zixibacteria bacterium]